MWSEPNEEDQDMRRGLAPGLAYGIVQLREIKNNRLVQIRDPFN